MAERERFVPQRAEHLTSALCELPWSDLDPADRNVIPGHVSLKQFQNVPRADIEVLLPSTQVRFRLIDTMLVGVSAVVSGVAALATKLLPTLGLIFLLVAAALGFREEAPDLDQTALVILLGGSVTLGGFLFRQWSKLKNRRVEYLKTLSENLYFRTLGDGAGVVHTLLSSAEKPEVVEAIVAYRFLLRAPDGISPEDLDAEVETWFRTSYDRDIDFEVDDALAKLHRLVVTVGDERLCARPPAEALSMFDRRWDDRFRGRLGDRRLGRERADEPEGSAADGSGDPAVGALPRELLQGGGTRR